MQKLQMSKFHLCIGSTPMMQSQNDNFRTSFFVGVAVGVSKAGLDVIMKLEIVIFSKVTKHATFCLHPDRSLEPRPAPAKRDK